LWPGGFAVAGLVPVILFHDMVIGVSGFMVTVFFLGFAISPLNRTKRTPGTRSSQPKAP
jgi:hypothetical protein